MYLGGLCALAMLMACGSQPSATDGYPGGVEEAAPSTTFTISQELYDQTLADIRIFVNELNTLIMKKDYAGWKDNLADEFFAHISSPEFLASASESAALKSRKIVLKTANDYFLQVVVPSRSNSKVDEIEFIAANRVKVFYREERVRKSEGVSTTEVRRLRLYELIKIDDTWKIID